MKIVLEQLARSGRQIASWYSSPVGAISAVALLLALGFSATGSVGAAVWVLTIWLGGLLPYKLSRERAERLQQASSLSRQAGKLSERLGRAEADLATTPTIEELSEWQESIERQSAALQAKFASLDQLRESVRRQRDLAHTPHDESTP